MDKRQKSDSPNSLNIGRQWNRGGKNKKPLYAVILIVFVLGGFLLYMFGNADNRIKGKEKDAGVNIDKRSIAQSAGQGVIYPPLDPTPEPEKKKEPSKTVVVVGSGADNSEAMRKRREQQYLTALSSPMIAKKGPGSGAQAAASAPAARESARRGDDAALPEYAADGATSGGYRESTAGARDKEGFFKRADTQEGGSGWISRYTRENGRLLEIKTGTVIPAVMVSGINSDLPGVMIAQVSQNIYNTANGQYLLIPQGAKLYGVYDSRVVFGQKRVLVAWNRVIFPDGSSVTLGAMPGADMGGYAGFADKVNNHYVRIFGSAFLMSAVMAGSAYAIDKFDEDDNNEETSFQDEMGTALASQMGSAAMALLQRNLGIAPTLEIRPGYRFNVVATKDVVFAEPYSPHNYDVTGGVR